MSEVEELESPHLNLGIVVGMITEKKACSKKPKLRIMPHEVEGSLSQACFSLALHAGLVMGVE